MKPCTRVCALLLLVSVGAGLSSGWQTPDISRQVIPLGQDNPLPPAPPLAGPAILQQDRTATRKLAAIREYIHNESWAEVTRALQNLLDEREDGFLRVEDASGKGPPVPRWTSVRAEADRLLGTLSPAGRELYKLRNDAAAQALFKDARSRNDIAALTDLVSRFRYTTAGNDALLYLATYELDRGHADMAALCFRRLLADTRTERAPATLFRAALAFQAAGDPVEAERLWGRLATRGDANLRLGSRQITMKQARAEFERWGKVNETTDWALFRGNSRRQAVSAGAEPLLEPRWQRPLTNSPTIRAWIAEASADLLPVGSPIAVAGRLYYRSFTGLHALDLATGREAWHTVSPLALESALANPGQKVQLEYWHGIYRTQGLARLPFVNSTTHTLSSDGQRLLVVEDLPLVPPVGLIQLILAGQQRFFGPLKDYVYHNRLRALDLGNGAVLWEAGRRARPGKAPGPLEDAFFLGPPLPLAGGLFVLVDQKKEIRLVCLDPATGGVHWSQALAAVTDSVLIDLRRRLCAAHLAYGEGVLVCPTGAGVVLAFDPLTHNLLWAHTYRSAADQAENPEPSELMSTIWHGAAPLIHDGCVVLAAPDSPAVECIRLRDGKLLWSAQREADDMEVGCVADDRVLIVGRSACRALKLSTGEKLWHHETGAPSGLGVRSGKTFYLPLQAGAILALDLEQPRHSARLECRSGAAPGNLFFQNGHLISQSTLMLTTYPQVGAWQEHLEEQLARSPRDPQARYERGRLRLDRGNVAGAVEDLRVTLSQPSSYKTAAQEVLFKALTQWLERDFPAGEHYLEEYRALCNVAIPDDAPFELRQHLQAEQQRRLLDYYRMVARGREAQGRPGDAFRAYVALLKLPQDEFLRADDPAVRLRSDLFVTAQLTRLWSRSNPEDQAALRTAIDEEIRSIEEINKTRLVDVIAELPGDAGAAGRGAQIVLLERAAERAPRADLLPLLLRLQDLEQRSQDPAQTARLLLARCRLLLRHGLVEDAAAAYSRLGTVHAQVMLPDGRSGAAHVADARLDRRLLASFDPPRLGSGRWTPSQHKGGYAIRSDECWPEYDDVADELNVAPSCKRLRLFIDINTGILTVTGPDGGSGWNVALSLPDCPRNLKQFHSYRIIDHLAVIHFGPILVGLDLLDHRVRWTRNLLSDLTMARPNENVRRMIFGSGLEVAVGDPERIVQRAGLLGSSWLRGLILQTPQGLASLDLATGKPRWQRAHGGILLLVNGDATNLCVADTTIEYVDEMLGVRSLKIIRQADGQLVPLNNMQEASTEFRFRRTVGTAFLIQETEPKGGFTLRLHDPLTGKDRWRQKFPDGSVILETYGAPHLYGILAPGGKVTVVDLNAGRVEARLDIGDSHKGDHLAASLLVDEDHYFVILEMPSDQQINVNPWFNLLGTISVNGPIHAFHRSGGTQHWVATVNNQGLLIGHGADKSPLLLCASAIQRPGQLPQSVSMALQAIDKNTGKVTMYPAEQTKQSFQDMFHTLRVDPAAGTVELIGNNWIWRHTLTR